MIQIGWEDAGIVRRSTRLPRIYIHAYSSGLATHSVSHTHARVCTGCRGVQVDSVVRSLDVIRAEWYKTMGEPSGANNAVLSLTSPNYDVSMAEHHRNLTIEDVRIDGTVGRILGLGLFGAPAAQSAVVGVTLRDVSARRPLQWWPTGSKAVAGDNFLIAEAPSSIRKSKAVATAESLSLGAIMARCRRVFLSVLG